MEPIDQIDVSKARLLEHDCRSWSATSRCVTRPIVGSHIRFRLHNSPQPKVPGTALVCEHLPQKLLGNEERILLVKVALENCPRDLWLHGDILCRGAPQRRSTGMIGAVQTERCVAERTLVEAIRDALHEEMERDSRVIVMGEDIGRQGGVFGAT
jgi:hypothetical protein